MNIKEILDMELTQEKIDDEIIRQGQQILAILSMPGWNVIESVLAITKINAEKARKRQNTKQSTREMALYYNGLVDGVDEAREAIYETVRKAEETRQRKQFEKESEAE